MTDLRILADRLRQLNETDANLDARETATRARDERNKRDLEATDYLAGDVLAAAHKRIDDAHARIAGEMNLIRLAREYAKQDRARLAAAAKAAGVTLEQLQALIDEEHGHA